MWINDLQKYNELVFESDRDGVLRDILLDDMNISIRFLVVLKKGDYIFVNDEKKIVTSHVKKGDTIKILIPEEKSEYKKQEMDLNILYEDEDCLVVEKPYGAVVHPTKNHLEDTLLNGLLHYFDKKGIKSKVRFVNRLDRYTSGILIVAKNSYSHSVMTKDNAMWEMGKEYTAVVMGAVSKNDTITKSIKKSDDGIKRIISVDGQNAITHYEIIAKNEKASLLKVKIDTGRTHQIRVHMESIGHSLFGDELYGGDTSLIERQALHSIKIKFKSPRKKEIIEIKNQLPKDIEKLIEILELNI